jgi:septal ring factor EnvC (AmiA/AmiB activator)
MRRALPLAAFAIGLAAAGATGAEAPADRVEALSHEAARIAAELKAGASQANQVERDLAALTEELARLAEREAAARAEFDEKRVRLRKLLAAFAALSRAPEPALLAHPDAPLAAARAAALMERIGPALIAEARGVEATLQEIAALQADGRAAEADLSASATRLAALRAELEEALAARRGELAEAEAEAASLARALAAAQAMQAALDQAAAAPPEPEHRFAEARGALTAPLFPAALDARYGAAPSIARAGAPRQGLWLRGTAHGAVLAPWSGQILFAGPFRRLRNVIILEPEKGYLIVLGGLATLSRAAGDAVKEGDVIGRLDGPPARTEELLIEMSDQSGDAAKVADGPDAAGQMLYMEVRENGMPTDPAPWLRSSQKVSGL